MFAIKRHAVAPSYKSRLRTSGGSGGAPVNLTGCSVRFVMSREPGEPIIDGVATILDALTGLVGYGWQPRETDGEGPYRVEWRVTFPDGGMRTFPDGGYESIRIVADIQAPPTAGIPRWAAGLVSFVTAPFYALVGTEDAQELKNKVIDGNENDIRNLPTSALPDSIPTSLLNGTIPTAQLSGTIPTSWLTGLIPTSWLTGTLPKSIGGFAQDMSGATGIAKWASGALSFLTAPSGAIVGTTDAQTLKSKTIDLTENTVIATGAADGALPVMASGALAATPVSSGNVYPGNAPGTNASGFVWSRSGGFLNVYIPNFVANDFGFGFGAHTPNNTDDYFHIEKNDLNQNLSMLIKNTNPGNLAQSVIHLFSDAADMRLATYSTAAGGQCNILANHNTAFNFLQLATARTTFWGPNDSSGAPGGSFPNAYFETDGTLVVNNVDTASGGIGKAAPTKLRLVNLKTHPSASVLFSAVADVADFGLTVFSNEAAGSTSSAVQVRVGAGGKILNIITAGAAPIDTYTNNTFRERIAAAGGRLIADDGVAGNPIASALVEMRSTTKTLLLPRMTSAQRTAIGAVNGLEVYDTDEAQFFDYYANAWRRRGIPIYTWSLKPATATTGKVIEISDVGDGGSFWIGNGADWVPMAPITLARSAVQLSLTGTGVETAIAAVTIPGGVMGKNGSLRIRSVWTFTPSTNSKTLRVRHSGPTGTKYIEAATTTATHNSFVATAVITNRNDPTVQVGAATSLLGSGGFANATVTPGIINTGNASQVSFTGLLASTGENINLESYEVVLSP